MRTDLQLKHLLARKNIYELQEFFPSREHKQWAKFLIYPSCCSHTQETTHTMYTHLTGITFIVH